MTAVNSRSPHAGDTPLSALAHGEHGGETSPRAATEDDGTGYAVRAHDERIAGARQTRDFAGLQGDRAALDPGVEGRVAQALRER
jgi:hypothetical protein